MGRPFENSQLFSEISYLKQVEPQLVLIYLQKYTGGFLNKDSKGRFSKKRVFYQLKQ
jgi:hypothetical protein